MGYSRKESSIPQKLSCYLTFLSHISVFRHISCLQISLKDTGNSSVDICLDLCVSGTEAKEVNAMQECVLYRKG